MARSKLKKAGLALLLAMAITVPGDLGTQIHAAYSSTDYAAVVQIGDVNGLLNFAREIEAGDSYEGKIVVLTNDIKFDGSTNNWTTISKEFKGTFDGKGHTISGINITKANNVNYIGLFGEIGEAGVVKNLNMTDIYLEAGANTHYVTL